MKKGEYQKKKNVDSEKTRKTFRNSQKESRQLRRTEGQRRDAPKGREPRKASSLW